MSLFAVNGFRYGKSVTFAYTTDFLIAEELVKILKKTDGDYWIDPVTPIDSVDYWVKKLNEQRDFQGEGKKLERYS